MPRQGMKRLPITLAIAYLAVFAAVLANNVFWPGGDQTDVIRAGLAAFPVGYILAFSYPGGRTGAFVAVTLAALLNAFVIFYASRRFVRRNSS